MRGIGMGQTVSIIIIPEVRELMHRQLAKASSGSAPMREMASNIAAASSSYHDKVSGLSQSQLLQEITG